MEKEPRSLKPGLVEPLTPRERDVLQLLAQHLRYQDIAEELTMALSSVKWYAQQIYGKLGVDNRRDAIEKARVLGLLEPRPQPDSAPPAAPRHNLPRQLTRFIGREKEIDQVVEMVRQNPLVTLTGAGGVGKTRLAQVAAGELAREFQHGVWLVELAPLSDGKLVTRSVAAVFGLQEQPGLGVLEVLSNYLREKQILILLDNCEHLIEACAQLAEHLLKTCTRLNLLATSREALGISGEAAFRVPSLSLPEAWGENSNPSKLTDSEAVSLFVDRAARSQAGFQLNGQNALAVAQICRRLDGIPLAIELASARVNVLSAGQIAARLDDRFRLLTGGSRTAIPRQQTLQASIDWSYSLLSGLERTLFQRLAVFAGGWTLEAAEKVCGFGELKSEQVFDLLVALVNKSLVVWEPQTEGGRYSLLETIRQYAQGMLSEEDREHLSKRHLSFFCQFAEQAEPYLRGKDQVYWMDRMEQELDNVRASLNWSFREQSIQGLRLASALMWLWYIRANRNEALEWFVKLLGLFSGQKKNPSQPFDPEFNLTLAKGFQAGGFLGIAPTVTMQGVNWLKEARRRYQAMGAAGELGYAICGMFLFPPNPDEHIQLLTEAEKIIKVKGDRFHLGEVYGFLGMVWLVSKGNPETALPFLEKSLEIRRELGDLEGIGFECCTIGDLYEIKGDYSEVAKYYQESLRCYQEIRNFYRQQRVLDSIFFLSLMAGKSDEASRAIEQQIGLGESLGDKNILISSLMNRALMAFSVNDLVSMKKACTQIILTFPETKDYYPLYRAKAWLAIINWIEGDDGEADKFMNEVIDNWQNLDGQVTSPDFFVYILPEAGARLVERHEYHLGVVALGLAMQSEIWSIRDPLPVEKARYDKALATARAALGDAAFERAWAEGAHLDALETLRRVLEVLK